MTNKGRTVKHANNYYICKDNTAVVDGHIAVMVHHPSKQIIAFLKPSFYPEKLEVIETYILANNSNPEKGNDWTL
jgi:hypothetical protein